MKNWDQQKLTIGQESIHIPDTNFKSCFLATQALVATSPRSRLFRLLKGKLFTLIHGIVSRLKFFNE